MNQLVTGDAVVLGLQPAKLPSRAIAVALDLTVLLTAYILLTLFVESQVVPLGGATLAAVQVAMLVAILIGVPMAVETLSQGRSLGKLALGLRVVRDDGGPIRFRHAFVRALIGFLEILASFGVIATVASLVSARGRRLGDVFAGTLVVRERIPAGRTTVLPPPPPHLAGRFATLDLSRVPDGMWLAIRQYLTRLPKLDSRVAWSMGVGLADELATRLGSPPPPGEHPASYLAAVAGERQRREIARTFRDRPVPPELRAALGAGPAPAGAPVSSDTPASPFATPGGSGPGAGGPAPSGGAPVAPDAPSHPAPPATDSGPGNERPGPQASPAASSSPAAGSEPRPTVGAAGDGGARPGGFSAPS
ncbi:RDD family protein [Streptomyces sp. ST2-7A]|uniref:RDD family protein n=1 Tax=Streptomyces sp. ST2-7A TaxID=2907214 RepID=UPI001F413FEA|nr:RDD family protein [Streptomyces sp. ST2-7A]MCE7083269.1 RDD family protein [Streptomyces sp. ST2-7A]